MPLPERLIVPVSVCRGTLQLPVPDELEGVTNGSLANIIRYVTMTKHKTIVLENFIIINIARLIYNLIFKI